MIFSINWLKDYVKINCDLDTLINKLFACGFEVENVSTLYGKINNIVTCRILSIEKHQKSKKLFIVHVDAGIHGILQIVTSATNIKINDIIPVALNNSTLYSGETIKTTKILDVDSYGMFCSGVELGIDDNWYPNASVNGILILDNNTKIGENIIDTLNLNDTILDISITANRNDCQSYIGMAREIAAILDTQFIEPKIDYNIDKNLDMSINVTNTISELVPNYIYQYVHNIKIEESPIWLKRRLKIMGHKSINNVVDLSNYILYEYGQPLHILDFNDINNANIIIRKANNNEILITFNKDELLLDNNDMVISDDKKILCLAGIIGVDKYGFKNNTKHIIVESASFAKDNIRNSLHKHSISTDSAQLFTKGVNLYLQNQGLSRFLHFISHYNYGLISSKQTKMPIQIMQQKMNININDIYKILGIYIDKTTIQNTLQKLGFGISLNNDMLNIEIPKYRNDIDINASDIAEEIIRELGYSQINNSLMQNSQITYGHINKKQEFENDIKNVLIGCGFNEIITYSFVNKNDFKIYDIDTDNTIQIINPISEDKSVMRTTLIPSMIQNVKYNINHFNNNGKLFEISNVYKTINNNINCHKENKKICLCMFGNNIDFYNIKGIIDNIIYVCTGIKNSTYERSNIKFVHPYRSANILINNNIIGYIGELNKNIYQYNDININTYIAEIDFETLFDIHNKNKFVIEQISKFPTIKRDICIVVDNNINTSDIVNTIYNLQYEYLTNINVYDIYKNDKLGQNNKSLTITLTFNSIEKTLKQEEIDNIINNILLNLKNTFNVTLRNI